jgi:preprotein translocase subunit SecA
MRLFGSDKIVKYMEKMGLEEGQELEHPLLRSASSSITSRSANAPWNMTT